MAIHVVSFSGGKDSTAMLLLMIENKMPIDKVIFIDTTKEFPDLYDHIEKVGEYIKPYGLKVDKMKIDFDYWFGRHVKTKGRYKGDAGYGWATHCTRWCTGLKIAAAKKVFSSYKGKQVIGYHGIALDEPKRIRKHTDREIRYPLVDLGFTERMALEYCYSKGFDWNGLYNHMRRVSCYCCPLSSIVDLRATRKYYPELWENMKKMDMIAANKFKENYSIEDLDRKFRIEDENPQQTINFGG